MNSEFENHTELAPKNRTPAWRQVLGRRSVQIALILLLLCLTAYMWLFSGRTADLHRDGKVVAQLPFLRNKVEVRYGGEFSWREALVEMDLLENDAVKTHRASSAMVEFDPQSFLKLGENALLLVRGRENADEVWAELKKGIIEGTINKPFRINTPKGEIRFEPGPSGLGRFEADLNQEGTGMIRVLEGTAHIKSGNDLADLAPGFMASVDQFDVKEITEVRPVDLHNPPDRWTYALNPSGGNKVRFDFGRPEGKYQLEVAQDPRFADPILAQLVDGGSFETDQLREGTYYWRVAEITPEGKRSAFGNHRRLSLEGGQGFSPDSDAGSVRTLAPAMILVDGANHVRVIRGGKNFQGAEIENIRPGDMISVGSDEEAILGYGEGYRMRLFDEARLGVTEYRTGPEGEIYSKFRLEDGGLLLRLPPATEHTRVEQVVKIDDRDYVFSTQDLSPEGSEILLQRGEDGKVELRVLSGKARVRVGEREFQLATLQSLRVDERGELRLRQEHEAVDLVLREGVEANVFYPTGLTLVAFTWQDRKQKAIFELARNRNFENEIRRQPVEGNRVTMSVPGPGVYFWRYRIGEILSPATRVGFYPAEDSQTGVFKATISETNRRIIFGHKPPVLTFQWKAVPAISRYRLEMYRDSKAPEHIFESEVVRVPEVTFFADFLGEGDYYWRILAIGSKGRVIRRGPIFHLRLDQNPLAPMVAISYPQERLTTRDRSIVARGMLFSEGNLSVNGHPARKGSPGPFAVRLDLRDGMNPIVFKEEGDGTRVSYYLRKVFLDVSTEGRP